jgi:hypothetical protein
MRRGVLRLCLIASVCVFACAVFFLTPQDAPQAGSVVQLYLDLEPVPAKGGAGPSFQVGPIPPNGSTWHELYPAYCTVYPQDDYDDNGDGVMSPCDVITLGGIPYHITWVGPTYYVTCSPTPGGPPVREAVFEPVNPNPTGNPICEVWHEVYPNFCSEIHIDSFLDNGNGVLDECDFVDTQSDPSGVPGQTSFYHIDRIGCNIRVEPVPPTPTERSTWGRIKDRFNKIFDND